MGAFGIRRPARVHRQLPVRTAVLPKHQNNLWGKTLGGWQFSGIFQAQTGTPCSVGVGNDYAGVGQDGSMCGIGQFWVCNGSINYPAQMAHNGTTDPSYWFAVDQLQRRTDLHAARQGHVQLAEWHSQ